MLCSQNLSVCSIWDVGLGCIQKGLLKWVISLRALLRKVHRALKPNGRFIFDVFTPIKRENERLVWRYYKGGGFFNPNRHIHLEALYQYDDEDKSELNQNIIMTDKDVHCFNIWNYYFDKEKLISEIQAAGFSEFELYGDVLGKEYSDENETICAVIAK